MLVDRLVAGGHLKRKPHATDRRRISLQPTTSAHDDVRAALDPLIVDITHITGRLDTNQANVILQFLTQITAALADFATTPADPLDGSREQ